jgi:hypothetical protein
MRFIAILILVLIPYWPVTEIFFPPGEQVDETTFSMYLLLCGALTAIAILLMCSLKPAKVLNGWLFFVIGILSIIPLHLGPPREGPSLLEAAYIEQFRYGLLTVAIAIFFVAGLKTLQPVTTSPAKISLVLLTVMLMFNVWDNCTSFMYSYEMRAWVDKGNRVEDFFTGYDFHELWRTIARSLLYLASAWLAVILFRRKQIRKWQLITLQLFCALGFVMCFLFLISGPAFYFPFMVPAIALAPAYWLGLMLLCNKKYPV